MEEGEDGTGRYEDRRLLGLSSSEIENVPETMPMTEETKKLFYKSKVAQNFGESGEGTSEDRSFLPGAEAVADMMRDPKKSKKSFYKNIKITNPEQVNRNDLVRAMKERFKTKSKKWQALVTAYSRCAFSLTFIILSLQVIQMVLLPMRKVMIPEDHFTVVSATVTAISALIAGCQLKLKMNEKAEKLKKGVKIYNRLLRSTSYYLMMTENGGIPEDEETIIFWQHALRSEIEDIPIKRTMASL